MYSPTIHALRGIAALMVLLYHVTNYVYPDGALLAAGHPIRQAGEWGAHGVYMFFVISGCVIPLSMAKTQYTLGALPRFLARRWVRIELPYIAAILAFLVVHYINCRIYMWNFDFEPARFAHHLIYSIPFSAYEWYNIVFWTLAIEFQFYLLLALVFPLLASPHKWLSLLLLLVFGSSALWLPDARFIFYYSACFGMGMSVHLWRMQRIGQLELWGLLTLFTAVAWWMHGWQVAVVGILSAGLIVYFLLDGKIFQFFGRISYSLYLIHGLVSGNILYWTLPYVGEGFGVRMALMLAAIVAAIPAAWLFWYLFERPSQRLSKRIRMETQSVED